MNEKKLTDQAAREKISTDYEQSFFVEAGAGSGKTHKMVDRMVGLILTGRSKIDNIVAVTFTRKAAAELRERFQIALEKHAAEPNAVAALAAFERCLISTIHSFCARLLRERPVEAGIDPGFTEIEESEDLVWAEEVWAEYLEKLGQQGGGGISELGIDPGELKDTFLALVKYPDVTIVTAEKPRPDLAEPKKEIKSFLSSFRKSFPAAETETGWDALQQLVVRASELVRVGHLDDPRLFIALLNILNKDPKITQKCWPDGDSKERQTEFVEFQTEVVAPALLSWQEHLHKPLLDFVLGGVRYYESWRKDRSLLNFQDLLMRTAALLRENPEVRDYFKENIQYLLVDEFQDTDPIQAEIIMLLTDKVKSRPGALFLVGDPKQTIYRFRRADIDVYNQVKKTFSSGAGEILELTTNFRSLEPIADITNTVFKEIFPAKDDDYQARFTPLRIEREKADKSLSGVFENPIGKITGNKDELIAEQDAAIIAAWINWAITGGVKLDRAKNEDQSRDAKPGDFLIITKVKKRLTIYARALERLGIPCEISGGESFSRSEELFEIYKVLKAVADPKNPVALLAALRGLFFGVSDNDLYLHAKNKGKFSFFSKTAGSPEAIKAAYDRLKEFFFLSRRRSPLTAIEVIIEQLGTLPLAVSAEMGSTRGGNILKAIELLRGKKADQTGSFADLVDYLEELLGQKGIEEMGLFPGTAKAVRLMNLHKAKGLEAPVVFLADPTGLRKKRDPELYVKRDQHESLGYFPLRHKTSEHSSEIIALPPDWQTMMAEEGKYLEAEKRRLDYVAVTRAKNILVISTYHEGVKEKAWQVFYPYLSKQPKLELQPAVAEKKRRELKLDHKTLKAEKEKIHVNLEKAIQPSYAVSSVTGSIDKSGVFGKEGAGKGAAWGRIVHQALEACGRGKRDKLEILARNWLIEENLPPAELPRLIVLVDKIVEGEMWQRVMAAAEKHFEIPFAVPQGNTVLSGKIDLIFKEAAGWILVDYKTDDFEKSPERKAAYQKQLDIYADLWAKATGEKIKDTLLFRAG